MFVVLVTQQAKRMYSVILPPVACQDLPYFSALSHKRHDFEKKKNGIENKMCVVIFPTTFVGNISHSKKDSATYFINVNGSSRKVPVILVRF